jgi:hypothetical protein
MYIFILLGVLIVLNYIDAYLTLRTFSKRGYKIEENPILRGLLRDDVRKFILFKFFDIFALSIIIYLINKKNDIFALVLLGICILLYSYINYKNYIITVKVER